MMLSKEFARVDELAATVASVIDAVAASRVKSVAAILLFVLIGCLPGFASIPSLDRDESAYAVATRHMVDTGDFSATIAPGLRGGLGVNWKQALSVRVFGTDHIWAYRLPSLLAVLAAAVLTWWMTLAFGRPRAALLAGAMVGLTPLLSAEAHLAKADGLLIAAIVLAEGALARVWLKKPATASPLLAGLFWLAVTGGALADAFTTVAAVGLTALALSLFSRSARWLNALVPIAGLPLTLLIVLAATLIAHVPAPLEGVTAQDDYGAPPGTYAILFYPLFGPAGVFAALAIPAVLDRARRPVFAFGIAAVVPYWLLMELMPNKLPPYILPAYPALALVAATVIDDGRLRITGWLSTYFALNLMVWPLVVGIGATVLLFLVEDRIPMGAIPFFLVAIVAGILSLRWLYREVSLVGSAALALFSTAMMHIGVFGSVLPGLETLDVAGRLAVAAENAADCDKPQLAATGFAEPSLVFAGPEIRLVSPAAAADFLAEGGCRLALVDARRQSIFNQRLADIGVDAEVRDAVRGYSLGDWRGVDMRVFALGDNVP